jgi:uncharacterized protein YaaN involved in tellurite resistance
MSETQGGSEAEALLPMVREEIVAYGEADATEKSAIEAAIAEIDMENTNSIIFFGAKAQEELSEISDRMLEGVRNKDTGPAGSALSEMLATLRGFDVEGLNPNRKPGFLDWIFGRAKPVAKFFQRYEEVRKQIDGVTDRLESHKVKLLTDITSLDKLYEATLEYFHSLARYIAGGEEKLRELDSDTIPAFAGKAEQSGDVLDAQQLRDLRSARDDLERRVHDLKLTRQVTMQALPSIRLVQQNDKSLVTKITSTVANTVPLWRQQLAQAVTIFRSGEAAKTIKEASDLTNELLTANAENLQEANAEVRRQVERGVFDIETVKLANEKLIETIEESLHIADEGKVRRAEAEGELQACEAHLRDALQASRARQVETGAKA